MGKTFVATRLIDAWRGGGFRVGARKPVQSFADPEGTDAALLAAATGEQPEEVCPPQRWYRREMAPPMAAESLGCPAFRVEDLLAELSWRTSDPLDIGVVELAGGLRSPMANDGDGIDFLEGLRPTGVVLVADAGLGTLNAVLLSVEALRSLSDPEVGIFVVLNRFDVGVELHRRNLAWLADREHLLVWSAPGGLSELAGDLARLRQEGGDNPGS